jgi:hypothetical protein
MTYWNVLRTLVEFNLITKEQAEEAFAKFEVEYKEYEAERKRQEAEFKEVWTKTTPFWKRWWWFGTPPRAAFYAWVDDEVKAQ